MASLQQPPTGACGESTPRSETTPTLESGVENMPPVFAATGATDTDVQPSPIVEMSSPGVGGAGVANSVMEEMCVRLVWARLHEMEALKTVLDDLANATERVEAARQQLQATLDRDTSETLRLASACLAGRVEIRQRSTFSSILSYVIGVLLSAARVIPQNESR